MHTFRFYLNFLVTVITLLFISCSSGTGDTGIKVAGQLVDNSGDGIVTLNQYKETGFEAVDTIYIKEDGSFTFFVNVVQPEFFRLDFYGRQQVSFIIEGNESEITVNAHGTDPNGATEIIGSEQSDQLEKLNSILAAQQELVQELNQKAINARMEGNNALLSSITDEYFQSQTDSQQEIKAFVKEIAPSLAAFYALSAIDPEKDFEFYAELSTIFEKGLPNHPFTKDLTSQVRTLRRLAIGADAPEIALPSPNGEIVTLSSLKGKYVLIDFWAAWCRPCRAENPNVVRMYNQYSKENFEILGVSLDRSKDAWVKAIDDDGLRWKHVSDLKYFNSEAAESYKIGAIPATYLIGPDGKIIAKNLRGPSLEAKLKEIFG